MQIENSRGIRCFQDTCPLPFHRNAELAAAADQLSLQLKQHPNKLVRLRMAVMLGAFLIVRYMADLEYLICRRPEISGDQLFCSTFRRASDLRCVLPRSTRTFWYVSPSPVSMPGCLQIISAFKDTGVDDLAQDYPAYGQPMKQSDEQICREVWQEAVNRSQS